MLDGIALYSMLANCSEADLLEGIIHLISPLSVYVQFPFIYSFHLYSFMHLSNIHLNDVHYNYQN